MKQQLSGFCHISKHHTKRTKQASEQSNWLQGKCRLLPYALQYAAEDPSLPNYQSSLLLVQKYILLHQPEEIDISLLLLGFGVGDPVHYLNCHQSRLHWKRRRILNIVSQLLRILIPKSQRYGGLCRQGSKHGKAHDDIQVSNVEKKKCTLWLGNEVM